MLTNFERLFWEDMNPLCEDFTLGTHTKPPFSQMEVMFCDEEELMVLRFFDL